MNKAVTDTKRLEERLRDVGRQRPASTLYDEAADALSQARREREEMEAALVLIASHEGVPAAKGHRSIIAKLVNIAKAALSAPSSPSPLEYSDDDFMEPKTCVDASPREEDLAEQLHYANGVADLAMKHRDIAEAALEEERERCVRRWRHRKRGTTYTEIGRGKLQMSVEGNDDNPCVIYRADADGSLWARPTHEFEDGRFEEIAAAICDLKTGSGE